MCGDVHVGVEGQDWVEMYTLGWRGRVGWRCTRWGGGAGLGGDVHVGVAGEGWVEMYTLGWSEEGVGWRCTRGAGDAEGAGMAV